MFYAILGLIVLASIGLALYALINKAELVTQIAMLQREVQERDDGEDAEIERLRTEFARLEKVRRREAQERDDGHRAEVEQLRAELTKLETIRRISNVFEKAKILESEITTRLQEAQEEADEAVLAAHKEIERMKARSTARIDEAQQRAVEIVRSATREADSLRQRIVGDIENDAAKAKEARRVAEWQANNLLEEAQKKAKEIASEARKEAKAKTQKVDETLTRATTYALEIREKAEARAREIGGKAYDALRRQEFYASAAEAMENVVSGYANTYMVPASHVLDELAEEYGFHKAGERLKIASDRVRVMEKGGLAATCNYPEGWKREYAINFVLSAFNGKVDSILARLKPANQGKLIQEIKDVYALANHNGEVFKNARIHEEYLDARLEELKWAVAVQRVKEKEREEQRAIREQIREEEKARREYERTIKQAEKEEETLTKAIERARLEYEAANVEDRAKYEAQLQDLAEKLQAAEEKGRRAISMAQLTKSGHVYVISNIGSFGEDVYKIGLTRREVPHDRIKELGNASVPFEFDVHAMIHSEDAPALEAALHRRFLPNQVNKTNRRKEFFRVKLQDIRGVIDEMKADVKWTMAAAAQAYRESLMMERHMQEDPEFRKQWAESEAAYDARHPFDDEGEESVQEEEDIVLAEGRI